MHPYLIGMILLMSFPSNDKLETETLSYALRVESKTFVHFFREFTARSETETLSHALRVGIKNIRPLFP